jgi:uncharacterized protein (TIGR03437 family)
MKFLATGLFFAFPKTLMPRAIFLFLPIVPLFAQFRGLSTTNDGSQLYFSSSLQLAGAPQENSYGKIFRYDSAGLHFVAQVDRVAVTGAYPRLSNPYNLVSGYISGRGSVVGHVGAADCAGFDLCPSTPQMAQTTLQYPGTLFPTVLPYNCVITSNAQYAACAIVDGVDGATYSVYNLFANPETPIYTPSCTEHGPFLPLISSDGKFLCGFTLWSASGSTTLSLETDPGAAIYGFAAALSDDGSRIVTSSNNSLYVYNVATGSQSAILFPNTAYVSPVSISSNGSMVLCQVQSSGNVIQFSVVHADGTGLLQLTNDPAGVSTGLLSGDGSTAFVVTNSGKLMKFDTASGASTLIAVGAVLQSVTGAAVAGAPNTITGAGLADTTVAASVVPLGTSLGGVEVTVNGIPAPLFSVSPTSISFQIPWETPAGNASVAVVRPASPFLAPTASLQTVNFQPVAAVPYAFSQNFMELTGGTSSSANPGDIVSFYLSGLGPVTVPVADGAASPSAPLSLLTTPATVSVSSSQLGTLDYTGPKQLNVLYAGLAPGLIGIYQLTVQLPPQIPHDGLFPNSVPFALTLNSSFNLPPVWVIPNQ